MVTTSLANFLVLDLTWPWTDMPFTNREQLIGEDQAVGVSAEFGDSEIADRIFLRYSPALANLPGHENCFF